MSETLTSVGTLNAIQPTKYVGAYWLGEVGRSIGFHLDRKPSGWHRFWMRMALGWTWRDDAAPALQETR